MSASTPLPTVAEVARTRPASITVFHRHGIDFCCGGRRPLEAACTKAGLEVTAVLAEIDAEEARQSRPAERWDERPLAELIDHILVVYHRPLDELLPRLVEQSDKVLRVHGDRLPDVLGPLNEVVHLLVDELQVHMQKEERILFPWILAGNGHTAGPPIRVMEHEHDEAGLLLARVRDLTQGFAVPEGACGTWTALWQGLEQLEKELHEHIHLENNVLFPRALSGESPTRGEDA